MPDPHGTGSGVSPSLFVSLRSFWSVLVAILYTRLDLVTAELEDEATRGIKLVMAGLVSLLCLFTAFFWAMFFLLALVWNTPYVFWVLGGIFGFYFIVGIGLLLVARNMIRTRPKFLSQTIAELRRDVEGLNRAMAAKKDEVEP
jgi:uncharacterized membrane protein YqjE